MSVSKPGDTPEPQWVGVRKFRGNMAGFLRQVREGRSLLIMFRDEVLAELRPPAAPSPPARQPGVLRGKIGMGTDFDTLPPDLLAAIDGEAEWDSGNF